MSTDKTGGRSRISTSIQRQRSIQMDDETYDLLVAMAEQAKTSRAAIIRSLIHMQAGTGVLDPKQAVPPAPVNPAKLTEVGKKIAKTKASAPPKRDIALPDTKADTFDVSGGKVRARRSRPKLGEIEL